VTETETEAEIEIEMQTKIKTIAIEIATKIQTDIEIGTETKTGHETRTETDTEIEVELQLEVELEIETGTAESDTARSPAANQSKALLSSGTCFWNRCRRPWSTPRPKVRIGARSNSEALMPTANHNTAQHRTAKQHSIFYKQLFGEPGCRPSSAPRPKVRGPFEVRNTKFRRAAPLLNNSYSRKRLVRPWSAPLPKSKNRD
jgi:hypothetical protein